jgi:hypothetical protein
MTKYRLVFSQAVLDFLFIPSSRHPVIPSSRHPVIPSSRHPVTERNGTERNPPSINLLLTLRHEIEERHQRRFHVEGQLQRFAAFQHERQLVGIGI